MRAPGAGLGQLWVMVRCDAAMLVPRQKGGGFLVCVSVLPACLLGMRRLLENEVKGGRLCSYQWTHLGQRS